MENTYYSMCMLILLFTRSTEGTPLEATENPKTSYNFKEMQKVSSSWEKGNFLKTKNISAFSGKDVTLEVDIISKSEIQDVQWVKNGINFATTKPFEGVTIRDNMYDGRLRGTVDGSLVIHNLAMEDKGEYKADIVMLNLKNYKIVYFLEISEESDSHRTHVVVVAVVLVIVLLVVAAGVAFLKWKQKMCFGNAAHIAENQRGNQARDDPEGRSEPEKEELQPKAPNPDPQGKTDDNESQNSEEFVDAKQNLEE